MLPALARANGTRLARDAVAMQTRYRIFVTRALQREPLSPFRDERLFDEPFPDMVWTGNGVRSDAAGRSHFIRHAIATRLARHAKDAIAFDVPKLLLLEQLRSEGISELRKWLDLGGDFANERLNIGDQIAISYEPRCARTRIVWPWASHVDLLGQEHMRSVWASFFHPPQSELARQLVRWTP